MIIEGHCCRVASEAYNANLGMERAEAAKAYLVGLGVDPALLTTVSVGTQDSHRDKVDYYLDRKDEFKWKY